MRGLSVRAAITSVVVGSVYCVVAVGVTTHAIVSAEAATNDSAMSGTASTMWQTNNNVEALAVSGGVVYAGGTFTRVRPPGVASGVNETSRTYLAAFNANTGALVSGFNVALNGRVRDVALAPGGTRLYIAGDFTTVNGQTRRRVAALNLPSGTLVTGFNASPGAGISAVDVTSTAVYVSGDFANVNGVARLRLASLNPNSGAVNAGFVASLDKRANAIKVSPDGTRVLVGGDFSTVNGTTTGGMASVDPATGALEQWDANLTQPINIYCRGRVTDIIAVGDTAYVTGEGDPPGCYEGTYSARITDGHLNWNSTCLGASKGLAVLDGVLYKASHQHDCAFNRGDARGGFVGGTSRDTFIWFRLTGQNVADGSFVHWSPNTNSVTGADPVGPHVLATDGSQIFVGGDFTQVNNQRQQGIARFGRGNNTAPNIAAPVTVQPNRVGSLTVQWPAVYDRDNGTLTYRLYRDGGTTPINTQTVESYPWSRPVMRFDDTGLTPGTSYRYQVQVSDGTLTNTRSPAASAVVRATAPQSYSATVNALGGDLHWRLEDTGPAVTDDTASHHDGGTIGGVAADPNGATGGHAVTLDGVSGYLTSDQLLNLSAAFTQSLWFKTTTQTGGSLLAVTDSRTDIGTLSDRAVTMDNNGNVVFSVHQPARPGSPDPFGPRLNNVRLQGPVYNDGRWHQVVATWTGDTAALYLDGMLSGTYVGSAGGLTQGYQRVGYTDLSREQAVFGRNFYSQKWPLTEHFNGSVDEAATFPLALSAQQVADLYAAGVNDAAGTP